MGNYFETKVILEVLIVFQAELTGDTVLCKARDLVISLVDVKDGLFKCHRSEVWTVELQSSKSIFLI